MRDATKEELIIESQIFVDAWSFLKKWYFIDGTDEQWEQLAEEAKAIYGKSNKNSLAKEIVLASISYIEQAEKERRKSISA